MTNQIMKAAMAILIFALMLSVAQAQCEYEARIRTGLVWFNVKIQADVPLTRKEAIREFSKHYNFQDIGDIYDLSRCTNKWRL